MIGAVIIALVGDLEGDRAWAVSRLRSLGERGDVEVVCQLGDLRFGMGPEHEDYLAAIESVCAEHGLRLLCINGNHEDWARLDRLWAQPRWQHADGTLKPIEVTDHVTLLPRGHRWELGGRSFVALGGAPSVNRHLLTEGVDWWPPEVISDAHVDATVAGGHAEVMLTHDSPGPPYCTAPVADIITGNPLGWPDASLAYAAEGIEKVTRAVVGVAPLLLVHGHFHVAGEAVVRLPGAAHDTTIWSLAANQDAANVRLLDLDTLTEPVPAALPAGQGGARAGSVAPQVRLDRVAARPTLVVAARTTWPQLPEMWPALSREVWDCVRAAGINSGCPNVMLYLDDVPRVEVGVLYGGQLPLSGRVQPSQLPVGLVATATHCGDYTALGRTHDAVRQWCREQGHELTGVRWEVYGPHRPDPDDIRVEVSWQLA